MRKVYVINKGGHDYSQAERFGSIVYCTEGSLEKFNVSHMVRVMEEALADSSADDFLLITSLATLCSVACAVFAVQHKRLNLLIFKDGDYVERVVRLGDR